MNLFSHVALAPEDPILGVVEDFKKDPRSEKINLSIGIYSDNTGRVPILKAVQKANQVLLAQADPMVYLPMGGFEGYIDCVQKLLFGETHELYQQKCLATVQTIGGTGALKVGADFLNTMVGDSIVYVSAPTWTNHIAIFEGAGFTVESYPYFDPTTKGVDFEKMYAFFEKVHPHSIAVLHACCHNPTGADLSSSQWEKLAKLFKERALIPFLDMAYQGFSQGVTEDAKVIDIFTNEGLPLFIANSFSKSFSIYSERVGALTVITSNEKEQKNVLSQLKRMVRGNYSSPPSFGAKIVHTVLSNPELYALWTQELSEMRERIYLMRSQFVERLNQKQDKIDFEFINQQTGMFSYSGLNEDQVVKLKTDYAIYTVDTGRICIAALNEHNIEIAANAVVKVL